MPSPISLNKISLRNAAIVSGVALLVMVGTALFSEMYAYPKLIFPGDLNKTIYSLSNQKWLFVACIFGYLITFILDIVVAWGLYILLKPVHAELSLLASWFRIIYSIIAFIAVLNLVGVYRMLHYSFIFDVAKESFNFQVTQYLNGFKFEWYFAIFFFSLHLILLGILIIKSSYIPKILGILLIITGLGYSLTTLKPFLFPNTNIDFASFTFYGELVFMIWLLIRGWKIKQEAH